MKNLLPSRALACLSSRPSFAVLTLGLALALGTLLAGACSGGSSTTDMPSPDLTATPFEPDLLSCPDCRGAAPICNPATLECVACLKTSDCGPAFSCVQDKCVALCAQSACASDAGSCDTDMGVCRGCILDAECGGATPRCDNPTGRCVACQLDGDNCPTGQYCVKSGPGIYSCNPGCKFDADCALFADGGAATSCCANACVDITSNGKNCGVCNKACGAGTTCTNSVCQ